MTSSNDHMNIFSDIDDPNELNANKKFIAKRAQIGTKRFLIPKKFQFFTFRYDKTSNRCSCFIFYVRH